MGARDWSRPETGPEQLQRRIDSFGVAGALRLKPYAPPAPVQGNPWGPSQRSPERVLRDLAQRLR